MNKQEAINELMSKCREIIFGDDENVYLSRKRTIELVSQINEPQKVVVPKFVAEWIEELKKNHSNLAWVWQVYPNESKVKNWLEANTEKFMRAWLDGFEIEQEKLYTVRIPNPNCKSYMNVLKRVVDGIIVATLCRPSTSYFKHKEFQLTESEIKQDFDFLWQWAKEVEEEE